MSIYDLPIYQSINLSIYLSIYLAIWLSIFLSIYLSGYLSTIYQSDFLSIWLSDHLAIWQSDYLAIYISIFLSISTSFLNISTSKSAPKMRRFVHVYFDVYFAPLSNVLRATATCTFSTSPLPKLLRALGVFDILTSTCASSHNSMHFWSLISPNVLAVAAVASLLFDPPEPQNIGKTVFRDFSTFSRALIFFVLIFFRLTLSLLTLSPLCLFPPLLFHLSTLSEVCLLNFLD